MSFNTSYLWGNDTVGGWGPRYFFGFYSELDAAPGVTITEVTLLVLTLVASLTCNISIAVAVLRYRELRTVTNCFLLNLAVADVVFALGIPAVAATRVSHRWQLGDAVCRVLPYTQFVCGFVLLWTLTLISMDRHRCIVVPPYRSQLTPKLASLLTVGTWLLAALLFLPVAFWFHELEVENDILICTLIFPKSDIVNLSLCFTIPVLVVACLLPMGMLVYYYQRIFQKLLSTRSRWAAPCVVEAPRRDSELSFVGSLMMPWARKVSTASQLSSAPGRNGSMSQHEEIRLNKHLRVVRVLLLNVIVVLLMWLPITVLMFLIYVDGSRPNHDTNFFLRSRHFIWALLVALLNTVVNPLLYGVLSENFRACFLKLWFGSKRNGNVCKTGVSKSNFDGLGDINNKNNRTPSSGRGNGFPQTIAPKNNKMSSCSIGSISEIPSGANLV